MRSLTVTESRPATVSLSAEEARELNAIGRRLSASNQARDDSEDDEYSGEEKTVIRCVGLGEGVYRVTVADAVGIVALSDLRLVVLPKIPPDHLRYLMLRAPTFASTAQGQASATPDTPLWELVAQWFVSSVEELLRKGLLFDYEERSDEFAYARGTIRPLPTAEAFYQGRLAMVCDYDEFSEDSPLNRILLAALNAIAGAPVLGDELRIRALSAKAKMSGVSMLRSSDLFVVLDRRSHFYDDAHKLALHVLSATGRTFVTGSEKAWTFLVRTPEIVETALRKALQEGLGGGHKVKKYPIPIEPSKLTLNPDLIFAGIAIGDVKYKVVGDEWIRPDLYQITAFAVGYGVRSALMIAFTENGIKQLPDLEIGHIRLRALLWDSAYTPELALDSLIDRVRDWLEESLLLSVS